MTNSEALSSLSLSALENEIQNKQVVPVCFPNRTLRKELKYQQQQLVLLTINFSLIYLLAYLFIFKKQHCISLVRLKTDIFIGFIHVIDLLNDLGHKTHS